MHFTLVANKEHPERSVPDFVVHLGNLLHHARDGKIVVTRLDVTYHAGSETRRDLPNSG